MMKKEFRFFTVPQWKKEEEYLRLQHKMEWKFVHVSGIGCYYFEKCEPEDVVYQLDYNLEGISSMPEYVKMFQDLGWEYLQSFWGYSYFRKPSSEMNGEEEIFCDDASKLEMMKRVFKGRIRPAACLFFLTVLPNLCLQGYLFAEYGDARTAAPFVIYLYIVMTVLYLALFAWFGWQYWEYLKAVRR